MTSSYERAAALDRAANETGYYPEAFRWFRVNKGVNKAGNNEPTFNEPTFNEPTFNEPIEAM